MSKNWYPVIDYKKCVGCLACYKFCQNKVYIVKDGKPFVKNPLNCIESCRGCQKGACNNDAITYHGDKVGEKKK